ncbi:MAG: SsrA-binding protein [Bacteroidetes bacterium]|jgi:SsrA-binding protein|nr:SsrA-binding protein [Bacteroidota bacterium]MBT5530233.1 SsrA-binding protein [Cytophagia bacterium]MBT3424213.1 SsrA-binding protein [Bacteroidota bacterium]MBT3801201.1 SsrA-binding protein [Bacteroidota bacterium]MBT4339173.1 SsrA-binding protein [Bacteroidota bacterium]
MNVINIKNKKAGYEYMLFDTYIAGIQLRGTEIKSIRQGKASLAESHCAFEKNELFIKNMNISEYSHGNIFNHEPARTRKLLLNHRELRKMHTKVKEKGFSIIAKRLFVNERGFAKMEIALAKGKKLYDKRESIKERDIMRSM